MEGALGKKLSLGLKIGESWEFSVRKDNPSIIANGAFKDMPFIELLPKFTEQLLGKDQAARYNGWFPLLFKFIDASGMLSIQVHPGDEFARQYESDFGKTEAWYVIDSQPYGRVFKGLLPGVTRDSFVEAVNKGTVEECLAGFAVSKGDAIFIPAGTVHSVCNGVLIYEVQENSDLTYRIWDRQAPGAEGKPRELHIEKALRVMDFTGTGKGKVRPLAKTEYGCKKSVLINCEKFVMERVELSKETRMDPRGLYQVMTAIEGSADMLYKEDGRTKTVEIKKGRTVFIPAALDGYTLKPEGELMAVITLPKQ